MRNLLNPFRKKILLYFLVQTLFFYIFQMFCTIILKYYLENKRHDIFFIKKLENSTNGKIYFYC